MAASKDSTKCCQASPSPSLSPSPFHCSQAVCTQVVANMVPYLHHYMTHKLDGLSKINDISVALD